LTDAPPTYVSPRATIGLADTDDALNYLPLRTGLSMSAPFADVADPRHEIAVAAVDIAARLLYLHRQVADAAETGATDLAVLSSRSRALQGTRGIGTDDLVISPVVERLPQLVARVQELEHALNVVAAAFKAAWHNDTAATGRAAAVADGIYPAAAPATA
jgi:hypothetical protein